MNTIINAAESLSSALWTLSWQIGVLILIVLGVSLIFRKASPNFRYCLWCVVLLRLCIPVALALPWGVTSEVRHAVEVSAPQVLRAAQEAVAVPWASPPPAASAPAHEPLGIALQTGTAPEQRQHLSLGGKLGLGWLCVSLSLLAAVILRSVRAHRILRHLPEIKRPELLQLVESLRSRCGLRRVVRVRTGVAGHAAYGPAVVGVFRPTILLPAHVTEEWSLDEIEPVLLHEFAHIKRWDLLLNWVQMVIQAVYFFHPLVWLANARIRQERELACDDLAVFLLSGQSKRYSRSFVRVIEDASCNTAAFPLASAGMTERCKPLARRIIRMMGKDYRFHRPLGMLSITLLLLVSATAIAVAAERTLPIDASAILTAQVSAAESAAVKGTTSLNGMISLDEGPSNGVLSRVIAYLRSFVDDGTGKSRKPAAGATVLLARAGEVETIQTEAAADGSFAFTDVPGGTYFVTVKPKGHEVITSEYGGWRLIDLAEGKACHVSLYLYHWEDKLANGDKVISLDVPQLESGERWSHLPDDLRGRAEDAYAAQHDNWLDIRRLSATYRWTTRRLKGGEWVEETPRTGTMAYEMVPLTADEAEELGHSLRLQLLWRVHDNELQWNAAADDIISGNKRMVYWQDGHASEKSKNPPAQEMLPGHLFSLPVTIMGGSYSNEHWANADCPREVYFEKVTPAIRLSTDEETEKLLGGEAGYMFLAWLSQPRLWISADSGQMRQLDMWNPGQSGIATRRYENYVQGGGGSLTFPSRIRYTWVEGAGAEEKDFEHTIELTDIQINGELPPETFATE